MLFACVHSKNALPCRVESLAWGAYLNGPSSSRCRDEVVPARTRELCPSRFAAGPSRAWKVIGCRGVLVVVCLGACERGDCRCYESAKSHGTAPFPALSRCDDEGHAPPAKRSSGLTRCSSACQSFYRCSFESCATIAII